MTVNVTVESAIAEGTKLILKLVPFPGQGLRPGKRRMNEEWVELVSGVMTNGKCSAFEI